MLSTHLLGSLSEVAAPPARTHAGMCLLPLAVRPLPKLSLSRSLYLFVPFFSSLSLSLPLPPLSHCHRTTAGQLLLSTGTSCTWIPRLAFHDVRWQCPPTLCTRALQRRPRSLPSLNSTVSSNRMLFLSHRLAVRKIASCKGLTRAVRGPWALPLEALRRCAALDTFCLSVGLESVRDDKCVGRQQRARFRSGIGTREFDLWLAEARP